ncbi:transposase [Streptomyces sp. YIM 121038]|uniref:transposase n=1 Tax=Streptomyces sp. YIM 121038 TaxID=2136401 RepID=UPI00201812D4|nr:transposase [Streptomyces sp. YIM 121038]
MWVYDRLDGLWHDEDFTAWYPRDGRPGLSPAQFATVSVLQFLLNLSDRQATEAVRCRIDSVGDLEDPRLRSMINGHARVVPPTEAVVEVPVVPSPPFR